MFYLLNMTILFSLLGHKIYFPSFAIYNPFSYSSILSDIAYNFYYDYDPFLTSYIAIVPSKQLLKILVYIESNLKPVMAPL